MSCVRFGSRFIQNKLFHEIHRKTGRAIGDFGLIEDGDRILVEVSRGKDSCTLLLILDVLRRKAPGRAFVTVFGATAPELLASIVVSRQSFTRLETDRVKIES